MMSVKLQWSLTAYSLETREKRGSILDLLTRTLFLSTPSLNYLPDSCSQSNFDFH
ncbi:TPA: hypothetical protein ACGO10_001029 [Streptococcus suis]